MDDGNGGLGVDDGGHVREIRVEAVQRVHHHGLVGDGAGDVAQRIGMPLDLPQEISDGVVTLSEGTESGLDEVGLDLEVRAGPGGGLEGQPSRVKEFWGPFRYMYTVYGIYVDKIKR